MAVNLYNQLNPQGSQTPNNILQSLAQNPIGTLAGYGLNIPTEFSNNPRGAVQHFLNNGTFTQNQLNQAIKQARQFGINL